MQITTYGLDLAKRVMQLHWVDMETGEIHRKQMKRRALLEFFRQSATGHRGHGSLWECALLGPGITQTRS
ncbi:hypothetical protein DLNHIDIE_03385 [Acidithiobacillus thiooxidans ATCC 19377]|uniref:Uncharacterized protein n=1 Tax=Acidithiobacillus thiooxidans ATCC 19377 TaxID=637390 RepID=A0A543PZ31_ACITH|nr:hypothetical protein DLNHIDIE_03385 [Acidithiobacillus thiooxidans ATCC 19377]